MEQDARPSDAIALAVRFDASIYVAGEILEEAGIVSEGEHGGDLTTSTETQEQPKELSKLEKLENELQTAIDTENYEKAARLRDEIQKLKG
jgi:bifunctional DNase/RNase